MQSDDSAGNQSVLVKIKLLLGKGAFPGASIFTGPEGAGKYETAVRAARALNCLAPEKPDGEGCGECLSCRKLDPQGEIKHLDVLAIRPEGRWFKIDQVRHIRREIYYRPYEGKKRVFILVQADRMTVEAANALLKVLEEPPEHAHFILLCSSFLSLLPTIRSRCLCFRFGPVPLESIVAWTEEMNGMNRSRARVMASLVRGNQLLARDFNWDDFSVDREKIFTLLALVLEKEDPVALMDYLHFTTNDRDALEGLTRLLVTVIRDIMAIKCGAEKKLIFHSDLYQKLSSFARHLDREEISGFLEKSLATEKAFNRNINKKIAFESLLLAFFRRHERETKSVRQARFSQGDG